MADLDELIDRIRDAPPGPGVAAVFDYDGTLIDGFSGLAFIQARVKALEVGAREAARIALAAIRGVRTPEEFDAFLGWSLAAYAGRDVDELRGWGREIFDNEIAPHLRPETWALLEAHRAAGHTIVIASSATMLQIEAIAEITDADHVLCTQLEVLDGVVTGRVDGVALWSEQKSIGLHALAETDGLDLAASFAYSDGDEDVPLLEAVGNPVAVSPRPHLRRTAEQRGWPVLVGDRTSAKPNPKSLVRTAAAYSGFFGGTAIAAGLGLLRRSRRTFVDTAIGFGSDLALTVAGIDVDIVEGREHLWAHRPCVFVFNHRSNLDSLIMMNVLREKVTAVAKQEVRNIPGFGQLFAVGGVAFIDRSDSTQIREALLPAVEALTEDGISLALAPEGTRWRTPGMGPFKKGAFHIARQAGVPVVPVVIRGAGTLMPRGGQLIQSGRIEVTVLPASHPASWAEDALTKEVEAVRSRMMDALFGRS